MGNCSWLPHPSHLSHWKVMHLKYAGIKPCIRHECAEKRLQLGMLADVGLRITTYSQCQPCDASQCAASRGELLDEVCLQVQVVEQVSVPFPGTLPSSAGFIPMPCWRGFSGLGRSLHPNLVELFDVSTLVPMSISSSTISSTGQLLGGHK